MLYDRMRQEQEFVPVGIVRSIAPLQVETRNVLACGDQLEYLGRDIEPLRVTVVGIQLENKTNVIRANPGSLVVLQTEPPLTSIETQSILRKKVACS